MPDNFILERIEIVGDTLISQNELNFKEGLNIITGQTGTGKSTILNIINFLINSDKKIEHISFLENTKIKYFLRLEQMEAIDFKISKSIFVDSKGLKEETIDFVPSSSQKYDHIREKVKIIFINENDIFNYLYRNEFYETLSLGEKFTHAILELTSGVENCIILLDGIASQLDSERNYLFFKYIAQLSTCNQVFLTLMPQALQVLRNYLVHREPEALDYLRQSQVLDLRGFWQKTIIDYFKEEPVSDYLAEFHQSINNIRNIVALQIHNQEIKKVLNRIMYANVIAVMETYLSECFTRLVIDNEYNKLKLLEFSPDFYKLSFNLRDAYDWLSDIDANIIEKIQGIVFHNIDKVISMFKNVLGIKFIDMGDISRAINKRHDIVHRNGRSKEGNILNINEEDILGLADNVEELIEHIERQVKTP